MIAVEQDEEETRHDTIDKREDVVERGEVTSRLRTEAFGEGQHPHRDVAQLVRRRDDLELERSVQWTLLFELNETRADDQSRDETGQTDQSDEEQKG